MPLLRNLFRILAISGLFGALVYAGTFLVPPAYGSYFTLYFPNSSPVGGLAGAMRSPNEQDQAAVRNLGGALNSPLVASGTQTATGILLSTGVLQGVLEDLQLAERWRLRPNLALKRLRGAVNVTVDRTGFLKVEAAAETPELAAEILKTLHRRLEQRAEELTLNVSRRNREFIEQRVKEAEARVQEYQTALISSLDGARRGNYEALMKAYGDLTARYTEARAQSAAAQATLDSRTRSLEAIFAQADSPTSALALAQLNANLADLAKEIQSRRLGLEDALSEFTDASPEVRRARTLTETPERVLNRLMKAESANLRGGTSAQLLEARSEMAAMEATLAYYREVMAEVQGRLKPAARDFAQSQRRSKEFEASLVALGTLRNELELARIAELRDPSRFELVDAPTPDPEPVSPRRVLSAGIGFLVALLFQAWPFAVRQLREAQ